MGSFTDYLAKSEYVKMNNPRGDLARDILSDPEFPKTDNLKQISSYLHKFLSEEQWEDFLFILRSFLRTGVGGHGKMESRDMTVKIRVEDFQLAGRFDEVKTLIEGIEKEYGDSHTLSIQIEISV